MIWIGGQLVSEGPGGVYGERMIGGYRHWSPKRSKLSALYYLGRGVELEKHHRVLYLGAANGTTVSHVADYVEVVYAVEPAPRPMQDLLVVAQKRRNIIPLMADARTPSQYLPLVEKVDIIYQDVAQPDQVKILLTNAGFLAPDGVMVFMLKPRSVDVTRSPADVAATVEEGLSSGGIHTDGCIWLSPYYPDHAALICTPE
ncbi:MAG: fibrillarin-like rRNA/tRNA 2'-O-methyltransferase [Methanoregulaceae archaeon]|jgi:fibrillarin-like pre-rRNA processing protein|nr:fibrillarin-like rRNA/tRNA 2'-O-methyltransferase [Methanoregulaceae archaeon]MCU0629258.1 fibrillarin-like rRNA/tRNA 2'-O-methyltransferase [Methanoregulaceae archaeon]